METRVCAFGMDFVTQRIRIREVIKQREEKKVCASPSYSLIYLSVTSQRGGAPVQSLGAQPFRNKDGGSSSMHAEDQNDAPRRVVVRFWKPSKKARQNKTHRIIHSTTEVENGGQKKKRSIVESLTKECFFLKLKF